MSALRQPLGFTAAIEVSNGISAIGALSLQTLGSATQAILLQDPEQGKEAIREHADLYALGRDIDAKIFEALSDCSPSPTEMRAQLCAMRMVTEFLRIGDLAKNISERGQSVSTQRYPSEFLLTLRQMAGLAGKQLSDVISAMDNDNIDLALAVWRDDQHLDAVYTSGFRQLVTHMMEDSRTIGLCTHLLFVSKNLERVGDHTTNLAELFLVFRHGVSLTDERPKRDTSSALLLRS